MSIHPKIPARRLVSALGLFLLSVAAFGGNTSAFADPGLSPATVEAVVLPGGSISVTKTVTTPAIAPKPDIVFLADTTGSMGTALGNVNANIGGIMTSVLGSSPDAQFGAAHYNDFGDSVQYALTIAVTSNTAGVIAAVNNCPSATGFCLDGGGDLPESQLNALNRVATDLAVGFRPGSSRIVVWFGDAPGHDPSGGITEAMATAALQATGIRVIAISVGANQLNSSGQAGRITAATGGVLLSGINQADVAAAILTGLSNLPADVTMQSDCAAPISTSFSPASTTVASGSDAVFTETISVAAGAAAGDYTCRDWATINGNAMTNAQGDVIYETKTIHVPGIDLTPPTATNELGTPGQTHSVTATITAGSAGPQAGVPVTFTVTSGPNAGATGSATTDAAGQATFTYTGVQGLAGLGTDTIQACFKDAAGNDICAKATKLWRDTTPPRAQCVETTNPAGNSIPKSGPDAGKSGQNPDGFYQLLSSDSVDPNTKIYVADSASSFVSGAFASGDKVKITQAPGATPSDARPGPGVIASQLKLKGDALVYAVDASGNKSAAISCKVAPLPK